MNNISLALVDDDKLIVSLLSDYLHQQDGLEVVLTAESGEDFLELLETAEKIPEVVVLDLRMKQKNGIEVCTTLKAKYPDIRTIIMSSHYNKSFIGFMLKTGVTAFIPKGISQKQLVEIIKAVHLNGYYFLEEQVEIMRTQMANNTPKPVLSAQDALTKREVEILKLICYQKTAKEISKDLFIAPRTVEGHKGNLLLKTGTKNIAGLVIYAIQNKIISADEIALI